MPTARAQGIDLRGHLFLDVAIKTVGVAELKNNLSRYLRTVEAGGKIEVVNHNRPIARLVPIGAGSDRHVRPAVRPFAAIRGRAYVPIDLPVEAVEVLLEERQTRRTGLCHLARGRALTSERTAESAKFAPGYRMTKCEASLRA
jgi:prevent-host-death family protein